MKKFSLPYIDQPVGFWQAFYEWRPNIEEIYFPINENIVSSGRPGQKSRYYFTFLDRVDLPKAVLINPIVLTKPAAQLQDEVLKELEMLYRNYGVDQVTVADLLLANVIKENLDGFKVCASVLMRIQSPEQIAYLQDDVDSLVLDTGINRDMARIKAIRDGFKGQVKLLVNEGCLPGCPYRIQHFYEMGSGLAFPESLCRDLLKQQPWLRLKSSWIPPQFLHYYDDYIDIIKLSGRVTLQDPDKYMRVFGAYLNRTELPPNELGCGPAGMIEDMPVTEDLFRQTLICDKKCINCSICREYYERYAE